MTEEMKAEILSVFESWVIEDPYPEVTKFESYPKQYPKPEKTIHGAWKDGYEFAKKLIVNKLGSL